MSEQKYAAEQHGKGERHDAAECYAPAVGVDDRAAKHGANGGAGRHHDARNAHGGAAFLNGEDEHRNDGNKRQKHARGGRLQHTTANEQEKRRRCCTKRGSCGECCRGGEEEHAGREPVNQKC